MSYYLGILDKYGRCLKVIRSRIYDSLVDYALETCSGYKTFVICDSTETVIWACKGLGSIKGSHVYTKYEKQTPIGRKMEGISL